jgi:hypothetical protein
VKKFEKQIVPTFVVRPIETLEVGKNLSPK